MQETALYLRWQQLAGQAQTLRSGGRRLRVLHPGRLNTSRGPDFTASRFLLDGVVYQGDVECHVQRQDWYRHGHHLDRAYANVLLHLVAGAPGADTGQVEHQFSEAAIPTLALPLADGPVPTGLCPLSCASVGALQEQALERLRMKTHLFGDRLSRDPFEQVFYEALFRAQGYSANSDLFQQLARRLPFSWLQSQRAKIWFSPDRLLALWLACAGLLPFRPRDDYSKEIVALFDQVRHLLPCAPLDGSQWQFAALRPANHPHLRLAACCRLFAGQSENPGNFLWKLFARRLPFGELLPAIEAVFSLPRQGYWQNHYALDKDDSTAHKKHFWGAGRTMEMIVNVFLPLFAARAGRQASAGFVAYLEAFYLWLPVRTPYAAVGRFFPWFAGARKAWPSQALYQAALHLRRRFCGRQGCPDCPLK